MIEALRHSIREELRSAKSAILLCSWGKESMLLLHLLREVNPDIPLIFWHQDLLSQQWDFPKKVIKEYDLTVHSYSPARTYIVSRGEGVSLVAEYAIGSRMMPVIHDIERSDRCILDADPKRRETFGWYWDVTFIGTKACDEHYITGSNVMPKDGEFGPMRLVAPLRDLSDNDVWSLIYELGVPFDELRYLGNEGRDPSAKHFCTRCLEGPTICPKTGEELDFKWDKQKSIDSFRERFGMQTEYRR